ncbi:hypothetical protein HDU93_009906 [Gonapodya sp. JEL0774]|nr:hypothetical protein HDU93_009906 [Gonapodya sp. JEL0774]
MPLVRFHVDTTYTLYSLPYPDTYQEVWDSSNGTERYVYLTHSWLLSMYLDDCPKYAQFRCPTAEEKLKVVEAIRRGQLTYHAYPFNTEIEYGNADLARYAIQLTHHIDDLVANYPNTTGPNLNRRKTVVLQRDVPGITQSVIPILVSEGVRAISFGCNAASSPVAVPHNRPFIWRNDQTGDSMLALYNDGSYGWELDPVKHLRTYPNATFIGATLEDVADAFTSPECLSLLETVDGEMGDTWIYGMGSDPYKTGALRALMRAREQCGTDPLCETDPGNVSEGRSWGNFSRWLLKGVEHTW